MMSLCTDGSCAKREVYLDQDTGFLPALQSLERSSAEETLFIGDP
jgi:hypothetical protein